MNDSQKDEALLLSLLQPFLRDGTTLNLKEGSLKDVLALETDNCGSYYLGVPFMEVGEQWPHCQHGMPMDFVFQIDMRHACLHNSFTKSVFVVYKCSAAAVLEGVASGAGIRFCDPVISVYTNPGKRQPPKNFDENETTLYLQPEKRFTSLIPIDLIEKNSPDIFSKFLSVRWNQKWEAAHWRLTHGKGPYAENLFGSHSGAWHGTTDAFCPPDCSICGRELKLVCQIENGDRSHSLWCCETHNTNAYYDYIR